MAGSAGIIKPGLERISRLLRYLGNPQNNYRTVQIAGTNGKGSTANYLSNILSSAKITTGLFTSPHMCVPEERIRVSGMPYEGKLHYDLRTLEKGFLASCSRQIKDRPTFFELATACALDYFREKKVFLTILEVGLGGRLDATSAAGNIGKILTDLSVDHREFLGNTIEEILLEKIVPLGGDFLISCPLPQHLAHLASMICQKANCRLEQLGRDFFYEKLGDGTFNFISKNSAVRALRKNAPGDFQYRNAAIAVAAAFRIARYFNIGHGLLRRGIREGVAGTSVPGRFQKCSDNPIVILDVGHNYLSAKVLQNELIKMREKATGKIVCVFTMMRNRNPVPFVKTLGKATDHFIFFPAGKPFWKKRMMESLDLNAFVDLSIAEDFSSAYDLALNISGRDGVVILTGSFVTGEKYFKTIGRHVLQVPAR